MGLRHNASLSSAAAAVVYTGAPCKRSHCPLDNLTRSICHAFSLLAMHFTSLTSLSSITQ